MRQARGAQYGKAMRTISQAAIAPLDDNATQNALRLLHPSSRMPIIPIPPEQLPPVPDISEEQVRRAAKAMNATSSAGPDMMSPRLLHLIVSSHVSPQAGVTGLSTLTNLIRRLIRGSLPDHTIPLIAAAWLIPTQPRPGKIRPIAVGQALRRLATKVLLHAAIPDTRDDLASKQVANGIPFAMDALVHDSRMHIARHHEDTDYVLVSVDASNAFNCFSRQRMLDMLALQTPSLARFISMIYGRTRAPLITPSSPTLLLESAEGAQQEYPASMLLFPLAIQPLVRKFSNECNLSYHRWYADEDTVIGRITEVRKVLQILANDGPSHHFFIKTSKTRAYWPSVDMSKLANLIANLSIQTVHDGGIMLLGVTVGSPTYIRSQL